MATGSAQGAGILRSHQPARSGRPGTDAAEMVQEAERAWQASTREKGARAMYDLLIRNGAILDGCGNPGSGGCGGDQAGSWAWGAT